jgi:nucleoside permease NupC
MTAVPATVIISKIIEPEIHRSKFSNSSIDETLGKQNYGDNVLDCILKGTKTGNFRNF